jgi:hypothetical protein
MDIQDGRTEMSAVGHVPNIGVTALDGYLAGSGQIEMTDASHVAGK